MGHECVMQDERYKSDHLNESLSCDGAETIMQYNTIV